MEYQLPLGNVETCSYPTYHLAMFFLNQKFGLIKGLERNLPSSRMTLMGSCAGATFLLNTVFQKETASWFLHSSKGIASIGSQLYQ